MDPWWMVRQLVADFNKNRNRNVAASIIKLMDKSMSAWRPQASKTGGLPHLTFILRKPEDLGTEFKNAACGILNIMVHLEIQEGKVPIKTKEHFQELGSTAACTLRLYEASKYCGQQSEEKAEMVFGDAWFGSVNIAKAIAKKGGNCILGIKTGFSKTPKKYFEELMEEHPAGAYFVSECVVPTPTGLPEEDTRLVFISYKYNARKVLSFIMTKNAGSTLPNPKRPYYAKFPDKYCNLVRSTGEIALLRIFIAREL
jgi:hypothetical protein